MDFNFFSLSRDLLYLSFLLWGAAAASFLIITRKDCTLRQRSVWITAIFCLSAIALAFLSASIILSNGMIFTVASIYPFVVLCLVLGGLALYFPRAGVCTVILAIGLFTAYISFSFLFYPGLKEPVSLVVRSSGTELIFRRDDETVNTHNDGRAISFQAVSITAYPGCPLVGGETRGLITRVQRDDEEILIFGSRLYRRSGALKKSWGFLREDHVLNLPAGTMLSGTSLSVLFNGKRLYFDPPIQL